MHRYRLCDFRECADPTCNHMRMQCMPCYGRARARKRQSGAVATTGVANTNLSFGAHFPKKQKVLFVVPYTGNVLSIVPYVIHTLCLKKKSTLYGALNWKRTLYSA